MEQHGLSTLATTVMPTVMPLIPASPRGRVITPSLYDVNVTELSASRNRWARSLATTFVRSELDSASKHFLAESAAATQGARARLVLSGRLLLYDFAQSWLGQSAHIHTSTPYWTQSLHPRILPARNAHDECCNIFHFFRRSAGWSRTDASAAFMGGSLHVITEAQLRKLLAAVEAKPPSTSSLLDIGAGTGSVTAIFAAALNVAASRVVGLEASAPLQRRLRAHGYAAAQSLDDATVLRAQPFGAVALLNILDRCDEPRSVLADASSRLSQSADSLLFVAVVLPFCSKVYEGKTGHLYHSRPPRDPLRLPWRFRCRTGPAFGLVGSPSFGEHAAAFAAAAFDSLPLRVVSWTRLPYLSTGDLHASHYYLPCALFVLQHTGRMANRTRISSRHSSRHSSKYSSRLSSRHSSRHSSLHSSLH